MAEGLFDEVVTEDGESPPFSFSHSPAPHHLGFKKQQPTGVKGRTFVSSRFSTEGTLYTHIKGSKERYLLGQAHNLQIFGVFPFIKLQNDI